jgi:regulator of RNase E activity RraA
MYDRSCLSATSVKAETSQIDLVPPGSVLFSAEPEGGLSQAVLGGLMGLTLAKNAVQGAVVYGRIRDLSELRATGLPIFSSGVGICASNEVAYPSDVDVPIILKTAYGVTLEVRPGDMIIGDENGVAVIPQAKERQVLELLPKLVEQDERVRRAIEGGETAGQAFKLRTV